VDAFPQRPALRQAQPEIAHPRGHRAAGLSPAIVLIIPRSPHLAAVEAPPVDAQVRLTLQKHFIVLKYSGPMVAGTSPY
jgi:hypothetical protein